MRRVGSAKFNGTRISISFDVIHAPAPEADSERCGIGVDAYQIGVDVAFPVDVRKGMGWSTSNSANDAQQRKELNMLADNDAAANLAVKDLDVAKKFYEGTLGLKQVHVESGELIVYKSGNTTLNVYRSRYAGTNQATAVTWTVGDKLDEVVRALKAKGIVFEHYEMPGLKLEGDVHIGGDMKVAWFKDPDGNILNVVSR